MTDLFMPPTLPENNHNLADAELCLAFLDRERAALAQELGRVVEVDGRTGFAIPEAPELADLYAKGAPLPSSRIKGLLAVAGLGSV